MCFDDSPVRSSWNPWSSIPPEFNLGGALTRGQVEAGRGGKVAILWENAAQASRSLAYSELEAVASIRELIQIIVVPYPEPMTLGDQHIEFGKLVSEGSEAFVPAQTRNDDIAFIAYTSGTTADPKGVVHYHRYPIAYEGLVRYWHDYRPDDVVACPSELGWLLPIACTFLYALSRGLTVVLYDAMGDKFDAEQWFALFQKYRITNFTAPPTTYHMMMATAPAANRFDMSCWRHAVSAGEPLPANTLEAIQRQFGITPIDGIGMTECMVYCFNRIGMPLKPGSCGQPGPGTVI